MNGLKIWIVGISFSFSFMLAFGQDKPLCRGIIRAGNPATALSDVLVTNKNDGQLVSSNRDGFFYLKAEAGDTLEIQHQGYLNKRLVIRDASFLSLTLEPLIIALNAVVITGNRASPSLEKLADDYSKKEGIYFRGRPPIALLSPFDGSPITFFYELLSKGGKRTRRLYKLAKEQSDFDKVDRRFNDRIIKQVVPIVEENVEDFKETYWPSVEDIEKWTDYELFQYIKESFNEFKDDKKG